MALVPAIITVNWISNYSGPHRVCYRVVGDPVYICTAPGTPGPGFNPVCLGAGNPCSYDIDIMVDNETCTPVAYEGYVQAICNAEASLVGRVPFTISFTPAPACKKYTITCDSSPVGDATIDGSGSGYTDGIYTCPVVGDGVGGEYDITVTGGLVTDIIVSDPGNGYTTPPTVDISSIPHTPGPVAIFITTLAGCPELDVIDCAGHSAIPIPAGTFQIGDSTEMCSIALDMRWLPIGFSSLENGNCLCDCVEVDIQNTFDGGQIDFVFIHCNGTVDGGTFTTIDSTGVICIVDGSLITDVIAPAVLNVINTGPCTAAIL